MTRAVHSCLPLVSPAHERCSQMLFVSARGQTERALDLQRGSGATRVSQPLWGALVGTHCQACGQVVSKSFISAHHGVCDATTHLPVHPSSMLGTEEFPHEPAPRHCGPCTATRACREPGRPGSDLLPQSPQVSGFRGFYFVLLLRSWFPSWSFPIAVTSHFHHMSPQMRKKM